MKDSTQSASDILIEHWQKGTTLQHLPDDVRPADAAAGYDIQRHIERLTSKFFITCVLLSLVFTLKDKPSHITVPECCVLLS